MTLGPKARTVLLGIGLLLLLGLAWTSVSGAIEQWPEMHTTGQAIQTAAQLTLGVFSALTIVVMFWGRRGRTIAFIGFALSAMLAGGLAPIVWGQQGVVEGLLAAAASLLIAQLIIWLLVIGSRTPSLG
jgi:hypothetical protein